MADEKSGEGWRRLQSGMRAFLEWDIPQSAGLDVTDWFLCRQLANDPQALLACLEALYVTSYAEFLPHNTVPCLLFVGTADAGAYPQTKRAAKVMGKAELIGDSKPRTWRAVSGARGLARHKAILDNSTRVRVSAVSLVYP